MPNWKKVITSGSNAHLNHITASGNISSSGYFIGTHKGVGSGINNKVFFEGDGGPAKLASADQSTTYLNFGQNSLGIVANGEDTFNVLSDGIVRVGTTGESHGTKALHVYGDISCSGNIHLEPGNINQTVFVTTGSSGTDRIRFGIGTALGEIPGTALTVSGSISSSGFVSASSFSGDGSGLTNVSATATPAGSDTQVQFNDGGSLGGDSGLVYNKTSDTLTATKIGAFSLTGKLTAGSTEIEGTAFDINGGVIDSTTIGGSTAAAGTFTLLTGTNITASGNISSSGTVTAAAAVLTTVDINGGTINGITDLAVADGGTGVSTLTDGGILLGNGTGAIQATAVLTDGQMLVGDGTTDPAIESGATLRTSIGVGTGDNVQFTNITGTGNTTLGNAATDTHTITGHTTASGNISSSGTITAEQLTTTDDISVGDNLTFTSANASILDGSGVERIKFQNGNTQFNANASNTDFQVVTEGTTMLHIDGEEDAVLIGTTTVPSGMEFTVNGDISGSGKLYAGKTNAQVVIGDGHITASGNISSSGTITTDKFKANLEAGVDNSVLIKDADGFIKTDEIDDRVWSSGQLLSGDGGALSDNYIPYTSDGASGLLDTSNLYWDTNKLGIGGGAVTPPKTLTVTGDISASGAINTLSHITASGNISSSGDLQSSKLTIVKAGASSNEKLISLTGGAGSEKFSVDEDGDLVAQSLTVDDITIDGSTISDTGTMNIDVGGDLTLDAAGKDIAMTDGSGTPEFLFNLEDAPELDVDGDFTIDGSGKIKLDSATSIIETVGNITASGVISSSGGFVGDGSGLTNVSATATPAGSDTQVQFNNGGSLGASSILTFDGSKLSSTFLESTRASVMNESGHPSGDFRVEGGGNTHLLFTDASEDAVGIKNSSPTAVLDITGDLRTSSHITASGNISASGTAHIIGGNVQVDEFSCLGDAVFGRHLSHQGDSDTKITLETNTISITAGNTTHMGFTQNGGTQILTNLTASGNISSSLDIDARVYSTKGNTFMSYGAPGGTDYVLGAAEKEMKLFGHLNAQSNITASGNISGSLNSNLTIGKTATVNNISASNNSFIHLNKFDRTVNPASETYSSAGQGMGDVVYFGTGTLSAGLVYYLNSSLAWTALNATDDSAGADELLGVALGSDPSSDGVLLRGIVRLAGSPGSTNGAAVYASTSAGNLSQTAPNSSGNIIRVCGYLTNANVKQMWFNPSSTWVEKS